MAVIVRVLTLVVVAIALLLSKPLPHKLAPQPLPPNVDLTTPSLTGVYAPNTLLTDRARRIGSDLDGPETVYLDKDGNIFGFTAHGAIIQVDADTGNFTEWAWTGGRPLAGEMDVDGNMYVCDAIRGLLMIEKGTRRVITAAARTSDGRPILFADDIEIASDGKVYFTDANAFSPVRKDDGRWGTLESSIFTFMEGSAVGRLIVYDPRTGVARTLLDDLFFANGLALSADESFILIAETFAANVRRYYLSGPKQGTNDLFLRGLPGFLDGMSRGSQSFWIAVPTTLPKVAAMLSPYPWARRVIAMLPDWAHPKPVPYGLVVEVDYDGNVLRTLQDPTARVISFVTAVTEYKGRLYLGSLHNNYIGVFDL